MVEFTDHALERMAKRRIMTQVVLQVLRNPWETITTKAERIASYARRLIVIIYKEELDRQIIVTAMEVDERKLKRLGFTKI